uniref:Uncharacterized protein n=1 Tax=Ditylum brightwellii TaxID=49249 RepID=A0A7S4RGX6_9STRA
MLSARIFTLICLLSVVDAAFVTPPQTSAAATSKTKFKNDIIMKPPSLTNSFITVSNKRVKGGRKVTSLHPLIPVDDWFFTRMGLAISIFNIITRKINRDALENLAWEQRLEEAREEKLMADPTLTELDLMREKGASSGRSYGNSARYEEEMEEREYVGSRRGGRVGVRGNARNSPNPRTMTDEEIADFEREYGVEYDPYYDEPYTEDELPTDMKFRKDSLYKDRRYENGEIFYYDDKQNVFYRQGSKPRKNRPFWQFW